MNFKINLLSKLKRNTGDKKFIPVLDGLRSLALLPVILLHFNTNYKRYLGESLNSNYEEILKNGERGVYLFFAISGFVLSLGLYNSIVVKNSFKFKDYFFRRLTRLEPPFIISTILLFLVVLFTINNNFNELVKNLLATLTYSHNFIYGQWSPINPVTWSLEVEIQFYVLVPILCLLLFSVSSNTRFIILLFLIILLPYLFAGDDSAIRNNIHLKRSLPVYFSHFLVGLLFLNLYISDWWKKIKNCMFWDFLGLVIILLFLVFDIKSYMAEVYFVDFCLFIIFLTTFKGIYLNKLFSKDFIVVFGGMCYSIYLIHYPLIFGISKVSRYIKFSDNLLNYIFQFLLSFIMIVICSSIFYLLFEKPFMKNNWWKTKKR